jgi:predicted extracellular nuclease
MISQVYGGGGNSGAPLTNDFVELHNSESAAISLAGWSLQYASSAGSTWGGAQTTALTGAIPAGGYYLVQLAAGTTSAALLPTPDAIGTTFLSATAGKVALVSSTTVLSGTCPIPGDATVVDFVGYGSANCSESAPAPAPSNTLAIIRAKNAARALVVSDDLGCTSVKHGGRTLVTANGLQGDLRLSERRAMCIDDAAMTRG